MKTIANKAKYKTTAKLGMNGTNKLENTKEKRKESISPDHFVSDNAVSGKGANIDKDFEKTMERVENVWFSR